MERNTNAIMQNANANNQRLVDIITVNKMEALNAKLCEQNQQLSEQRIISSMKPVAPIPAYVVGSPYAQNVPCC